MPSIVHPTSFIPSVRFSHRKAALLATVIAAGGASGVAIAVVDDGGSVTGLQSLSRPAPDVRFNGGPTEGTAVQSMRPAALAPLARPSEGVAVQSMARSDDSGRYDGGPEEGVLGR